MDHQLALELRTSGKTLQEISVVFGVSRERIRQVLAKHGIRGCLPKPIIEKPVKPTREEVFWSILDKNAPNGCWEWKGNIQPTGYGVFGMNGENEYTHRLAWRLTHGPIPAGMHICHKCDNPPCCNPDHLFLGTPKENMQDREAKGRGNRGKNRQGKLKTHCKRGHEFTQENTYIESNGGRRCRICNAMLSRKYYHTNGRKDRQY